MNAHTICLSFRKFESNNTVIAYQNVASLSFYCLSDVINTVYWLLVGLLTDEIFLNECRENINKMNSWHLINSNQLSLLYSFKLDDYNSNSRLDILLFIQQFLINSTEKMLIMDRTINCKNVSVKYILITDLITHQERYKTILCHLCYK